MWFTLICLDILVIFMISYPGIAECYVSCSVEWTPFSACRLLDPFQRYSWSKSKSCLKSSALLITNEPLHSAWWNFARTCTSRTLLNFKVKGEGHIGFLQCFSVWWCFGYPWTVLSLEQGLTILLLWCCAGVYFTSRVEHVKFVDFCGKYRLPLMQYLCSPHCQTTRVHTCISSSDQQSASLPVTNRLKRVLLG